MASMHVRIVCPEHLAYEGDAAFLVLPSTDGSMGVLPRHASEICTIEAGFVRICDERMGEVSHEFAVGTGYVQVADDNVIILAERAEDLAEVTIQELQARLESFEEKLGNLSEDDAHRAYLYNEISWCKLLLGKVRAA